MEKLLSHALRYESAFREFIRWGDIPDCVKYREFLESPDKEVVTMTIELLKLEGVDEYQIRMCNERFLHLYYWEWPHDLYENEA